MKALYFDPNSGQVHPGKLVGLFKAAAESVGVEIFEQTAVLHVEEGERLALTTKNGRTVRARSLVLATTVPGKSRSRKLEIFIWTCTA
jgi:glycine/D-amino acid oxidase-like deaminating enzyme